MAKSYLILWLDFNHNLMNVEYIDVADNKNHALCKSNMTLLKKAAKVNDISNLSVSIFEKKTILKDYNLTYKVIQLSKSQSIKNVTMEYNDFNNYRLMGFCEGRT